MIIRIAYFDETSPVGREWITAALQGVDGVQAAYHAAPADGGPGYVSVAVLDDMDAEPRSAAALSARREELGVASKGPDRVAYFVVNDHVDNARSI
ncbi:MAG TPA: hypothetical protein VIM19_01865 [Actinomycetes bacterium]